MKKVLSLMSALLVAFCFNFTAYAATPLEWTMLLHLGGKQRMYTQKMCKEILLIAKGVDVEANKRNLQRTIALFDRTLDGLVHGNARLRLAKTTNPAIVEQLDKVDNLWQAFRQTVEMVIDGNTSPAILKKLTSQNMPLLENLNKALSMYEKESGLTLEASQARTINLAGKQRMLTQKMTKEFLLMANGIAPDENQAKLQESIHQFERTLKGLLDGDDALGLSGTRNGAIRAKLKSVRRIWKQYKPILAKSDISQDDLAEMSRLNVDLLTEVDNTVKMQLSFLK